jgi:translation elongation factor EF-1beta
MQNDTRVSTWLKLENSICEASNMAFLLAASIESRNEGKEEAIAFGIYKLQDLCRETKKLFDQLADEIRTIQVERGEVVTLEEDELSLKVVNLH